MKPTTDSQEPPFELRPDRGAEAEVRDDIVSGLSEWFEELPDGFRLRSDLHTHGTIRNERVTAVVWRYETRPRPEAWGVAAGRRIFVHGATFVDESGDEARFSRYVDWHGVFSDLGVSAAGRIVREPS
ncbi:MAG TPA: hypothetical protein VK860_00365 [Ilumatobacteraceae bacterium]|nr:hypothetical protein [Ilumatobacteraceae bacterium]